MPRVWAGFLAVFVLKLLSRLPPGLIITIGSPFLPIYVFCRHSLRERLRSLQNLVSFSVPTPLAYYRMRLRIAALSLRHLTGHIDDVSIRVEGEEHYLSALTSGKPVALLGWHQGPVELLHRIPAVPQDGRPFFIFTAGGFAPMLTQLMRNGREQSGKQTVPMDVQHSALRSWARQHGVLAVMVDQVPGRPKDWISLWNGKVEIPHPRNLMDWLGERNAVCLAVSVGLEKDRSVLFRYQPVQANEKSLGRVMEKAISEVPDQYNWSYPKIRFPR